MSVDKNEKRKEKLCFAPTKQGALQILHPVWSVFIPNLLCLCPEFYIKKSKYWNFKPAVRIAHAWSTVCVRRG